MYSKSNTNRTGIVVDDDPDILALVAAALAQEGYDVLCAADLAQAVYLATTSEVPLDFLITDYQLGAGTGLEVATAVRRVFPSVRVLVVSGSQFEPGNFDGIADEFLAKPFSVTALISAVRRLFEDGSTTLLRTCVPRGPGAAHASIGQAKGYTECDMALLHVNPSLPDRASLRAICRNTGWSIHEAGSMQEALQRLGQAAIPVTICERDLPDGDWCRFLEKVSDLVPTPLVIVASRLADARLWGEVLNLGAFDLLATPFVPMDVRHVISHAWRTWTHRQPDAVAMAG